MTAKVVRTIGPRPARIAVVGEAPGSDEEWQGLPFVGASGQALNEMFRQVGIDRPSCLLTNVFDIRPPSNNLASFGVAKDVLPPDYPPLGPMMTQPSSLYIAPEHLPQLSRLQSVLTEADPNVIIALGNTACWALLGEPQITKQRGTVHLTHITGKPVKVIPTFHPAAVLRQWTLRPVACADLTKALAESAYPERRHTEAELWLRPTLEDLEDFAAAYMASSEQMAVDVETRNGMITEIGFAPAPGVALNIPFRLLGPNPHYWSTLAEEQAAWRWVRKWCESDIPKVLQNGMYDVQYLLVHGIRLRRFVHDTMLAHHSLYSELRKDLGFLGSVYTNYPSWKYLAGRSRADDFKKDA